MAHMQVETRVNVYEENDVEVSCGSNKKLVVKSHDSDNEMVVLSFGDTAITVVGSDLEKAITNARNVGSH